MPGQATGLEPKTSSYAAALLSRNPLAWLTSFGPGAVIASLTIGAGELIFSSRAGAFLAIFGALYGTIEVAPVVLREILLAMRVTGKEESNRRARTMAVL